MSWVSSWHYGGIYIIKERGNFLIPPWNEKKQLTLPKKDLHVCTHGWCSQPMCGRGLLTCHLMHRPCEAPPAGIARNAALACWAECNFHFPCSRDKRRRGCSQDRSRLSLNLSEQAKYPWEVSRKGVIIEKLNEKITSVLSKYILASPLSHIGILSLTWVLWSVFWAP